MATSDSQDQILEAVMSVIMREGVSGASMRTVAEEADVSVALLSYHFDDKDSLIAAAYERAANRLLDVTTEAVASVEGSEDRIQAWIRAPFIDEFLSADYLGLRVSLWAVARVNDKIAEVEQQLYGPYADGLADLIAEVRTQESRADIVDRVTDILVVQNGLWLNHARYANLTDLERGLKRCEAIALG
jgi:AcrR family transcriptional regulator